MLNTIGIWLMCITPLALIAWACLWLFADREHRAADKIVAWLYARAHRADAMACAADAALHEYRRCMGAPQVVPQSAWTAPRRRAA